MGIRYKKQKYGYEMKKINLYLLTKRFHIKNEKRKIQSCKIKLKRGKND